MDNWQQHLKETYPKTCSDIYCGAHVDESWRPIVEVVLEATKDKDIQIVQIKDKWGGLRIYYDATGNGLTDEEYVEIDRLIADAEAAVDKLEQAARSETCRDAGC